jgi:hypothetical protein
VSTYLSSVNDPIHGFSTTEITCKVSGFHCSEEEILPDCEAMECSVCTNVSEKHNSDIIKIQITLA